MAKKKPTIPVDKAKFTPWFERVLSTPLHKKKQPAQPIVGG